MLTVTAGHLARLLAVALPATMDPEDCHPILGAVHLAAGGGVLTATATNRYIAVHARTHATGALRPTLLPHLGGKLLLDQLKETDSSWLVEIRASTERIIFNNGASQLRFTPAERAEQWPADKMAKIFTTPAADTGVTGFHMRADVIRTVGRVLKAARSAGTLRSRWTLTPLHSKSPAPFRIEVGDWLAIVAMPMRLPLPYEDDFTLGPVPYGLPEDNALSTTPGVRTP